MDKLKALYSILGMICPALLRPLVAVISEDELCTGDVVRLNSGGPRMTVDAVCDETGIVICNWFDRHGCHREVVFWPSQLQRIHAVVPDPYREYEEDEDAAECWADCDDDDCAGCDNADDCQELQNLLRALTN